jgi:hypothetical protein
MRIVFATLLITCALGCSQTPIKRENPLPPAVPISDPVMPADKDIFADLGLRVRTGSGVYAVLDKEPAFMLVAPTSTEGIVPVARLHERLNKMQLDSLDTEDPIVRYEVIDLEWRTQYIFYQFDESDDNGLRALALVYTAKVKDDSVPLSAKRMVRDTENGGTSKSSEQATLRVTLYEFELQPVGVERRTDGKSTTVDIGTQDWKVVSMEKVKSADASHLIGDLPVNDPSALVLPR